MTFLRRKKPFFLKICFSFFLTQEASEERILEIYEGPPKGIEVKELIGHIGFSINLKGGIMEKDLQARLLVKVKGTTRAYFSGKRFHRGRRIKNYSIGFRLR